MAIDPRRDDLRAAQVVPTNTVRVPFFHWRPEGRLIAVGDRDGPAWDAQPDPAAGRTFQRGLTPAVLAAAQARFPSDGLLAAWSGSLAHVASCRLLLEHTQGVVAVATAGEGDRSLLDELLGQVAAWSLLVDAAADAVPPLAEAILTMGRHVEVRLGLSGSVGAALARLPLAAADAVHLEPRRATDAVGAELVGWEDAARAHLPRSVPTYDSRIRHTVCTCGVTLVWRSGSRASAEGLTADGTCRACGRPLAAGRHAR